MRVLAVQCGAQCPAWGHSAALALLSLLPSVETVNDGQFHSVELVMLNQTLNLVVDKGAPKSLGKLQKQPAVGINSPLYLGGKALPLPPLPLSTSHLPPPGLCSGLHSGPLAGVPIFIEAPTARASQGRLPGGGDNQAQP